MKRVESYPVELLTRMVKIYAPTGHEEPLAHFILEELERLGLNAKMDDVGNVIAKCGSGMPRVLLCGHMDTVDGIIEVRRNGNKLYGRGAVDAKGSLASMIATISEVIDAPPCSIVLAAVVDEEGVSKGIKHFIEGRPELDYAIFGEPSGAGRLIAGYKGRLHIGLRCATVGGHSAAPWLSANALEKGFELWQEIKKMRFAADKPDSHFYSLTSCLIQLSGGAPRSVIPSECRVDVDVRVPPQYACRDVISRIADVTKNFEGANPGVSLEFSVYDQTEAYEVDRSSLLVKSFTAAIRRLKRERPVLLRKTGTGDMNLLAPALNIPAVAYGPGDSRLDHTADEYLDVDEFILSIRVYREALNNIANYHSSMTDAS